MRQYEVRTSPIPLTEAQWVKLLPALTLRAVQPPGAEETVVVSGLSRGQLHVFVVRSATAELAWSPSSNMATLATENDPPVAVFRAGPDSTSPEIPVTVDAGATVDLQDATALLEVRWDWEDDGVWDTGWSTRKTAIHSFAEARVYAIRLEARDRVGGASQSVRRVVRGPTLLQRSERVAGYWEEVVHCPDPGSPHPLPCSSSPEERRQTFLGYGQSTMSSDWEDFSSSVGVDTLRFDGGVRPGAHPRFFAMWVSYDVVLDVPAPVRYQLTGHSDCDGVVLRISGGNSTFFDVGPCAGGPQEIEATGVLVPGVYRVHAAIQPRLESRLSFVLVFGGTAGPGR